MSPPWMSKEIASLGRPEVNQRRAEADIPGQADQVGARLWRGWRSPRAAEAGRSVGRALAQARRLWRGRIQWGDRRIILSRRLREGYLNGGLNGRLR
jgi:hypothetical protein